MRDALLRAAARFLESAMWISGDSPAGTKTLAVFAGDFGRERVEVAAFTVFAARSNLIGARFDTVRDECLTTFSSLVGGVDLAVVGEEVDEEERDGVGTSGTKSSRSSVGVDGRVWTMLGADIGPSGLTAGFEMFFGGAVGLSDWLLAESVDELSLSASEPLRALSQTSGLTAGPRVVRTRVVRSPPILTAEFCSNHHLGTWLIPISASFALSGISCL